LDASGKQTHPSGALCEIPYPILFCRPWIEGFFARIERGIATGTEISNRRTFHPTMSRRSMAKAM
jgi:hypothetical protein